MVTGIGSVNILCIFVEGLPRRVLSESRYNKFFRHPFQQNGKGQGKCMAK